MKNESELAKPTFEIKTRKSLWKKSWHKQMKGLDASFPTLPKVAIHGKCSKVAINGKCSKVAKNGKC